MTDLDRYFPKLGPCAICCKGDARHRVIDMIVSRFRAGEAAADIAADMNLSTEAVRAAIDATPQGGE